MIEIFKYNRTINFERKTHMMSISLGAVYCNGVKPVENVLERADSVLCGVKQAGKNGYKLLDYGEVKPEEKIFEFCH